MWLHIPPAHLNSTSSRCAPESGGLNLASCSPSIISERLAEASATWRGKLQPPPAWQRRWKQGGFITRLSGLTCSPSEAQSGVASFISSLRETPARITASPESAPGNRASDFLRLNLSALPMSAGLILSSARTFRGTQPNNLKPSSRHWSDWATALRAEYSARPKPEIPCGANDCSSWPAPNFGSENSMRGGAQHPDKRRAGGHQVNLQDLACHWHAARANDPEKRGAITADPRTGIAGQAENWNFPGKAWPAPASRDHKGSSEGSITRKDGKSRADMLDFATEQFFLLPSFPVQEMNEDGLTFSIGIPNTNQPSPKRKLNPIFVEALMRWPTGLSGFERPETAWTRWQQLMPSYLSSLVSSKPKQGVLFE